MEDPVKFFLGGHQQPPVVLELEQHRHPGQHLRRPEGLHQKLVRTALQGPGRGPGFKLLQGDDQRHLPGGLPGLESAHRLKTLRRFIQHQHQVRPQTQTVTQGLFKGIALHFEAVGGQDGGELPAGAAFFSGNNDDRGHHKDLSPRCYRYFPRISKIWQAAI